jgi:trimeric autotransporter adhesin
MRTLAVLCLTALLLSGAEHRGQVKFNGLPVPGATVTATQAAKTVTAITDQQGVYSFPDLPDGPSMIQIEMLGFAPIRQEVAISPAAPSPEWDLKMLPLNEMQAVAAPKPTAAPTPASGPAATPDTKTAQAPARKSRNAKNTPPAPTNTQTAFQRTDVNAANPNANNPNAGGPETTPDASAPASDAFASQSSAELSQRAADGFLINGTANNGASSPFSLAQAFGNGRRGSRSLYSGNLGLILDSSALDARPFSLTGQSTPRPGYNHAQGVFAFGGPLKIPHLLRNGPQFFINYQWIRNRNPALQTGLMPTQAERDGDFSHVLNALGQPVQLIDPSTGSPIPSNTISQISSQAKALLRFYGHQPAPG